MNLSYKGFESKIWFSAEADIFYGEVLNCDNLISFQTSNPQDVESAMQDAINQYLSYLSKILHLQPSEPHAKIEACS